MAHLLWPFFETNLYLEIYHISILLTFRGGSRAAAVPKMERFVIIVNGLTSKMERFVIIVNGFQPLTIITKRSFLDVAAALDPPLYI